MTTERKPTTMKLTETQKLLAETNHNLIYGFAHRNNLNVDRWYGLLAQSLCEAVLVWDEDVAKLSTLFNTVALNNLINEKRNLKHQCRSANNSTMPILEDIDEDGEIPEYGHIPVSLDDNFNKISEIEWLSDKYGCPEKLVELLIAGKTQMEIAESLNLSQARISQIINQIKTNYEERQNDK